jgi:ribonuclease VapC
LIVLDTSSLMAILLSEQDESKFSAAIAEADQAVIGAPTRLEFFMVATGRLFEAAVPSASEILDTFSVECLDWTAEHAAIAVEAFLKYGKGQNHPAKLNFGDCMAYALAKSLDAPLLYKGGDFALTDIKSAI